MINWLWDKMFSFYLNQCIKAWVQFHLKRVKKQYLKKVREVRVINYRVVKDSLAHINTNMNPPTISFQLPDFKRLIAQKMSDLISDNVIDALRHEFAHLKYLEHGKQHTKWAKQIKLFKK